MAVDKNAKNARKWGWNKLFYCFYSSLNDLAAERAVMRFSIRSSYLEEFGNLGGCMKQRTIQLPRALAAWGTSSFADVLKAELEELGTAALPLQEGLSRGNYVSGDNFQAMVITALHTGNHIQATVGIHYQSVIAGCSCADDPTPIDELSEYCQLRILFENGSSAAQVTLQID